MLIIVGSSKARILSMFLEAFGVSSLLLLTYLLPAKYVGWRETGDRRGSLKGVYRYCLSVQSGRDKRASAS